MTEVYEELVDAIEFVAAHQQRFSASRDIYGSFRELADRIRDACAARL